jgi:hypothetical protein
MRVKTEVFELYLKSRDSLIYYLESSLQNWMFGIFYADLDTFISLHLIKILKQPNLVYYKDY